jgi:hypothetical protein
MGSFALLLVSLKSPQQPSVQSCCFAIFRPTDVIEFREIFLSPEITCKVRTKQQHQNSEFGHTQGEIIKKNWQKSTLAFKGG